MTLEVEITNVIQTVEVSASQGPSVNITLTAPPVVDIVNVVGMQGATGTSVSVVEINHPDQIPSIPAPNTFYFIRN